MYVLKRHRESRLVRALWRIVMHDEIEKARVAGIPESHLARLPSVQMPHRLFLAGRPRSDITANERRGYGRICRTGIRAVNRFEREYWMELRLAEVRARRGPLRAVLSPDPDAAGFAAVLATDRTQLREVMADLMPDEIERWRFTFAAERNRGSRHP